MGQIKNWVERCRKNAKAAGAGKAHDEALYQTLVIAYRIIKAARKTREYKTELNRLYIDSSVDNPRTGSHKFTRLLRLCLPNRNSKQYNHYANALYCADKSDWDSGRFQKELRQPGGMSHLADIGRKQRKEDEGRSTLKRPPRLLGRDCILKGDAIGSITGISKPPTVSAKTPIVVLLGRKEEDGSISVVCPVKVNRNRLNSLLAAVAQNQNLGEEPPRNKSANLRRRRKEIRW